MVGAQSPMSWRHVPRAPNERNSAFGLKPTHACAPRFSTETIEAHCALLHGLPSLRSCCIERERDRRSPLTTAVYRLDTNTRSTDPNDATRIIQAGGTRTNGFKIGTTGSLTREWKVSEGLCLSGRVHHQRHDVGTIRCPSSASASQHLCNEDELV